MRKFILACLVVTLLAALIVPNISLQNSSKNPSVKHVLSPATEDNENTSVVSAKSSGSQEQAEDEEGTISSSKEAMDNSSQESEGVEKGYKDQLLACDTESLNFEIMKGELDKQTSIVGISNEKDGYLSWDLSESAEWLTVSRKWGISYGEKDIVYFTASAKDLGIGLYTTNVEISSSQASNSPIYIEVNLEVLPPRILPMIAGTLRDDTDGVGIGYDAYKGINLLFINGEDTLTCPTFDMVELDIHSSWEGWFQYGDTKHDAIDTHGDPYSYYDIVGGELWGMDETLWAGLEGEHPAEGTVVGGQLIDWGSAFEDMKGAGWLPTIYLDTGSEEDLNGDDPGDLTMKCFLVKDFGVFIMGAILHIQEMFDERLWGGPEDGMIPTLVRELPGLLDMTDGFVRLNDDANVDELIDGLLFYWDILTKYGLWGIISGYLGQAIREAPILLDQVGEFLAVNDENIVYEVGQLIDIIVPIMPIVPGIIDFVRPILPLLKPVLQYLMSPMPELMILQPSGTT